MTHVFDDGSISNIAFAAPPITTILINASFEGTPGTQYREESQFAAIAQFKGNAVLSSEYAFGAATTSLKMDGQNQSLLFFPKNTIYQIEAENDFLISLNIRRTGGMGTEKYLYSQTRNGKGFALKITPGNKLRFEVIANAIVGVNGATSLLRDIDYLVKAEKKGNRISISVNDVEENSLTRTWVFPPSIRPVVGNNRDEPGVTFEGYIANLFLSKTVFNAQIPILTG